MTNFILLYIFVVVVALNSRILIEVKLKINKFFITISVKESLVRFSVIYIRKN